MAKQEIKIKSLVDKVINGELRLPEMQRRYVWRAVKVRDLLDSLYRGYPSGTILVWETDQDIHQRGLQVKASKSKVYSSSLLLLDGQQRLTSLSAILTGQPIHVRNKQKPIEILFNLDHPDSLYEELTGKDPDEEDEYEDEDEEELETTDDIMDELRKRTFVVASKRLKNQPHWISVTDVFQKTERQLLKNLNIESDELYDKYSERIKKVKAIEDYNYTMEILDRNMSYEEVTEIFVRVNSLGAKLRGSDLALAQITSRWRGFMEEQETFIREFEHNQDYLSVTGILTKTMIVFATNQSKFKTVSKLSVEELEVAWKKTQIGLRYAINLLKSNVKVENLHLLSSPFLLIPIAYYAVMKKEKLTDREQSQLLYWFYLAHTKGHYSHGSTETILDSDISVLMQTKDLKKLLQFLKSRIYSFTISDEEIEGKNLRSPYFSLLFFICKQKQAKDWNTGIVIHEKLSGKSHALQFHHIFPKANLKAAGYDRRAINDIANLAFISGKTNRKISNTDPSRYLKDVDTRSLKSQLIPSNPALWKMDQYEEFLQYRRKMIANEMNRFLEQFR